jgi:tetratricopeptide (TPR) repeat protein
VQQALDAFVSAADFSDATFSPNLNNNKALALFRLGRNEEALSRFQDALSSAPLPDATFYYNRGESAALLLLLLLLLLLPLLPLLPPLLLQSFQRLQAPCTSSWPTGPQRRAILRQLLV